MIYVPELENYKCYVVMNDSTIRAYKEIPNRNSTINYRDYYYSSHYLYQDGSQQFSQYSTLPVCLDNSKLTSDFYYRTDFDSILIIFIIIVGFVYFILRKFIRVHFLGFREC